MTALEVLKAKGVPAGLYEGKSQKEINALARAIDSEWKAPVEATVEVVAYTPSKSKKGAGMYLKVNTGNFGGIFERLCDGGELTKEGRAKAVSLLASIANQAADLMDRI
jgi:hypothetical protein